jgi:hypothetical protein
MEAVGRAVGALKTEAGRAGAEYRSRARPGRAGRRRPGATGAEEAGPAGIEEAAAGAEDRSEKPGGRDRAEEATNENPGAEGLNVPPLCCVADGDIVRLSNMSLMFLNLYKLCTSVFKLENIF